MILICANFIACSQNVEKQEPRKKYSTIEDYGKRPQ